MPSQRDQPITILGVSQRECQACLKNWPRTTRQADAMRMPSGRRARTVFVRGLAARLVESHAASLASFAVRARRGRMGSLITHRKKVVHPTEACRLQRNERSTDASSLIHRFSPTRVWTCGRRESPCCGRNREVAPVLPRSDSQAPGDSRALAGGTERVAALAGAIPEKSSFAEQKAGPRDSRKPWLHQGFRGRLRRRRVRQSQE
jgi:hypothetical protein